MPGQDGTGPQGTGPITGRGSGFCVVQLSDGEDVGNKNKQEEVIQMPGGDKTGPVGMGPMTGRGAGVCSGYNVNPTVGRGGMGRGMGRGAGSGRGFGRGFGWRSAGAYGYGNTGDLRLSSQEEARGLKDQARIMQEEINVINARIKELESDTSSTNKT